MKAVIMAGGLGTRIYNVARNIPKPMIKINNKPVLEYIIDNLREQGFIDLIITVSHQANIIIDYFKDGKEFGVNIEYFVEDKPLGNAGALYKIKEKLTDNFLLLNADSVMGVDFNKLIKYHEEKNALVTILTHPTTHPEDCGLIVVDNNNMVIEWLTKEDKRPQYFKNRVNAGIHVINKKLLETKIDSETIDLDRQILKSLANTGKMYAYDSIEYVRDMGTPERLQMVCNDIEKGLNNIRKTNNKQKAVIIDFNQIIDQDFNLIEGVDTAIKKLNDTGYLAIAITHNKEDIIKTGNIIETLLSKKGVYFDAVCLTNNLSYVGDKYNIDYSLSWIISNPNEYVQISSQLKCKKATLNDKNLLDAISIIINE